MSTFPLNSNSMFVIYDNENENDNNNHLVQFIENVNAMSLLNLLTYINIVEASFHTESFYNKKIFDNCYKRHNYTVNEKNNGNDNDIYNDTCCVCLNNFVQNQSVSTLYKCKHTFCRTCLDKWLENREYCPMCRTQLL
ncbi:hypothetical protein [Ectropis obliqua nucleopolyhedrovirus]|uniref:RING-type domain-containing protein n=1 Tax=Ectropis obliqua nucleopolyhedrovirus TaxID=59376 RepID=A0EYX3_9ABAC|nr:hypothetical protein EONV_gp070 [Ectropis obliqua nucleopolyhedrovirus]ABI35753.1 hypothetical protein [Ectropis obliqua nucleopolyhedrovirus]QWV59661.1 hypothetical protein EONV_gp070 [Ectropis obliqua nucleopolyhedrovirus]UYO72868.1 hypothetical protein EONV-gp070 [Ectropis obliqua nucleopolyhedrovirus]